VVEQQASSTLRSSGSREVRVGALPSRRRAGTGLVSQSTASAGVPEHIRPARYSGASCPYAEASARGAGG